MNDEYIAHVHQKEDGTWDYPHKLSMIMPKIAYAWKLASSSLLILVAG